MTAQCRVNKAFCAILFWGNELKNIVIRKMMNDDIIKVVEIWFETSIVSHNFISKDYWKTNKKLMENKYLPMSETYLATDGMIILGFIALIDEYLAAIFVKPDIQGKGIGSSLLDFAKNFRKNLQLKVYVKNRKSIEFYKAKGFSIISESIDGETGENEFVMEWHK